MSKYSKSFFMTRKTEIIQIKISPDLKLRFQEAITVKDVQLSMSAVIRKMVENYIIEFESKGIVTD